ncbi:hypothetical protein R3P38DRAFT_3282654 [Favolaschia claudopus]|uniref:Uncharacterized protein n=1 Tax=Favolaschia claudopus TaxID=2862362 RepID=A0AAW0ACS0_9AGAR
MKRALRCEFSAPPPSTTYHLRTTPPCHRTVFVAASIDVHTRARPPPCGYHSATPRLLRDCPKDPSPWGQASTTATPEDHTSTIPEDGLESRGKGNEGMPKVYEKEAVKERYAKSRPASPPHAAKLNTTLVLVARVSCFLYHTRPQLPSHRRILPFLQYTFHHDTFTTPALVSPSPPQHQ